MSIMSILGYFSLRRRCPKLFQNYFRGLLQLMNIFQRVRCFILHVTTVEIVSQLFQNNQP